MTWNAETRERAEAIVARYPERRSAVMPLLYLAMREDGGLTPEGMREVADHTGLTAVQVESVASFYTMYRLRPTGTHLVNVCTNLACKLRGAGAVYEAARDAAGLAPGQERSEDGLISVHEEECLGVCDFAPAVQINFMNQDEVSPERVRELIAALRSGTVPQPSRGGHAYASLKEASRALAGLEEVPS
jgi:NADH-quinone oxidoreductase subunit E